MSNSRISTTGPTTIGYVEELDAPLLEDATVRLANCFIRCVLNYAQNPTKESPLQFRDERLAYTSYHGERKYIHAIDDGGIHVFDEEGEAIQVAILESKRAFKKIVNGVPIVSDELLAQMVGEVLALRLHTQRKISNTDFITVLATAHYIKFFHFEISDEYLANYENLSTVDPRNNCFLRVSSTVWYDIKIASHREHIVAHLLALIAWVDL